MRNNIIIYIYNIIISIIKKMKSKILTYPLKVFEGPYTKGC